MHTTTIIRAKAIGAGPFGPFVHVGTDLARQQLERALAGFLAGYSGQTMTACRVDLTKFIAWLDTRSVAAFEVKPAHIELYARWSETQGLAPATMGGACRRSAASPPTAPRDACSIATLPRTYGVRSRTTSRAEEDDRDRTGRPSARPPCGGRRRRCRPGDPGSTARSPGSRQPAARSRLRHADGEPATPGDPDSGRRGRAAT